MKVAEVQALAVGTPLYAVDFDPSHKSTVAVVCRCVVTESKHTPGVKFPSYTTTRYPDRPVSVNARHCYRTEDEATAELVRRVTATRDYMNVLLSRLKHAGRGAGVVR